MTPLLRTALRMTAALAVAMAGGCERPAPVPGPTSSRADAGPDAAPPAVPGGLQAYAVSESEVRLTWEPAADGRGPVSYEVLRGDSLAGRTPSLDAADHGLAADQEYCYAVQAVDGAGNRSGRAGPACVRTPDRTPPTPPGTPVVTILEPGGAGMEWSPSTDNVWVEGYEVLREDRVVASGAETTAGESGLAPGRPYCWTVRAFDRAGNRSPPSPPGCATTPDRSPPTVPGSVTAMPGPGSVALAWAPATDDAGVEGYEVLEGGAVVATVETTTWAGRELPAGERCYTVRAFDRSGNRSAPSGPACGVVPDTTPPSRPEGLTASAPGETAVVLRWQAARDDVGVARYEVVRGEALVARAGGPAAGEEGLRPASEYCYQVRALDAAGNRSEPSAPACASTPDLTPPSVPRQVGAVATSDRTVDVSWRPSTDNVGVAGYDLLRGEEVVARSDPLVGEVLRVQVTGLAPGREHCFSVRARDLAGLRSAPSSPACAATPDLSPPTVPSGVQAVAVSGAQVALAWQPSTDDVGVVRYEVSRGDATVASVPGTEAEELGLRAATVHCYRVRAVDAAGNRSGPSAEACATTAEPGVPAAPTRLEASAAGPRSVTLRWQPSADAGAVYAVFWDRGQRIGTTRFTTYRVDGLKPGERRCFQVASLNAAGQSSATTFPVCAQAGTAAARP